MKIRTLQDALDMCERMNIRPDDVLVSLAVELTNEGPRFYDPNERRLDGYDGALKRAMLMSERER